MRTTLPRVLLVAITAASSPFCLDVAHAAPPPPAGAALAPAPGPTWGLVARGGFFGLPDFVADKIFAEHPEIGGWIAGAELRYHGDGGARGISSIGLAVDHGSADADGLWQAEESDRPQQASGRVTMTAITLTSYWSLLPSLPLHPYLGLGFGAAWFKGEYEDEDGPVEESGWLPVVHVPVGLALELGEHAQLALEARFLDGLAAGGALHLRF